MKNFDLEMSEVKKCDVTNCGFNVGKNCHAKAITIGDSTNPGCDTFMDSSRHTIETRRIAGVGACKVDSCSYNSDFECTAGSITVGRSGNGVKCLTFKART